MIATLKTQPGAARPPSAFETLLGRSGAIVMGILNVTPDSFSDGGQFITPAQAIAHARRMAAEGADILDIGGASSRPYGGNIEPTAGEEKNRLEPVLAEVVGLGVPVSIDTTQSTVADWALRTGAAIVNDVWGLQRDPDMARVVAEHRAPVIVMHNRHDADAAVDIMADITAFLSRSLDIADKAGIPRANIVLDPGIGFGKTQPQSLEVLARLDELLVFGLPILVGASRKRFIASITPAEPQQRLGGSLAAHLTAVQRGAKIIRTHDVAETVQALRIHEAIESRR